MKYLRCTDRQVGYLAQVVGTKMARTADTKTGNTEINNDNSDEINSADKSAAFQGTVVQQAYKSTKHQPTKNLAWREQGISAWVILPWILLAMLAIVVWILPTKQDTKAVEVPTLPAQQTQTSDALPQVNYESSAGVDSYHDAVAKAAVSVVNIYTTQQSAQEAYYNDPAFREFLEQHGYDIPESRSGANLGSGVIVSEDGYIITNAHVVDKADEIIVALSDGKRAAATVIGADPDSDLAVIKVQMTGLTPLAFRDSAIRVGDVALAIGNPFGVGQTVTQGIVSATGRTGLGISTYEDFIQTDAAINPGNSGGALVDAHGNLIGINTVIYSRSGGSMGIGFAIPTSIVEKVMNDIINTGRVSRGWLGIEVGRTPLELGADNDTQQIAAGVQIITIVPNAAADRAGLQVGDVILSINDVAMNDANALIQYISKQSPNSSITVQILRGDKQQLIDVVLDERPTKNP